MRTTAYIPARPKYGLADIVGLLFRELWIMILVFILVVAVGAAAVMTLKKTYVASASIYAGVGQEYAYEPRVGPMTDRSTQPPSLTEVAQNEAAIIGSREVKLRAVRSLGLEAFQRPGKPATGTIEKQEGDAIKFINDGLEIGTAPLSPVIALSFESDNAQKSADVLNALIGSYREYRREVFQDTSGEAIEAQRRTFEEELGEVDASYEQFLQSNEIGDFAAAKAATAAVYQSILTDRMMTQAQLDQTAARLRTLEQQQASTPAEVTLQQDLNVSAQDQIRTLRAERAQLLSRYLPDAQPVRDIEARIAEQEALVAAGGTVGAKEVRIGPNTVWTEVENNRINAAADRDALADRLATLNSQLATLRARQADLTRLESENAVLMGNRDILTATIREFQQRGAQNRADNELVRGGADNIRVLSEPAAPTRGSSLKLPLLALVILFAGFTALCVGLLRVVTRRGYVTPASVGRTLDLPVLAVTPVKA
ncbi:GumC family protein [Brevundimonas sp. VNH65]|uniref:GumC family protein n=1 Tax=Brevundimonas sp. VNH65 TaxID=3400917 RepID=UPI003C087123